MGTNQYDKIKSNHYNKAKLDASLFAIKHIHMKQASWQIWKKINFFTSLEHSKVKVLKIKLFVHNLLHNIF
jgi:hypothetical protein